MEREINKAIQFSTPLVVDEGVAFSLRFPDGSRRVAVITKSRLGVGDEAQGLALLAAFARASDHLCREAARLAQSGKEGAPVIFL